MLCTQRAVCTYTNASDTLFAPFSAPACAPSSIVDWGAEEKAINIFAARSIRAYSLKHFSVLSTHLLTETHRWGTRSSQINPTMSQSGSLSVSHWISRAGTVGILPWSQCDAWPQAESLIFHWRIFVTAHCCLKLTCTLYIYKYTAQHADGRTRCLTPPTPKSLNWATRHNLVACR